MTDTSQDLGTRSIANKFEEVLGIIKPDGVKKKASEKIFEMLTSKGLTISRIKMTVLTEEIVKEHYGFLREKSFFPDLVTYMTSGEVIIFIISGPNAISVTREVLGATDPTKAMDGTIRKLFGESIDKNAMHASDSVAAALIEIARFYSEEELATAA